MMIQIITGIVAAVIVCAAIVLLLSFFAPTNSHHSFWMIIGRLRGVLDLACYWMFNFFALVAVLCAVWAAFHGLLKH